jgi:Bacterial antitoxin of type II TA system, VapB
MRTTIDIDLILLAEAQQVSRQATKKQIVDEALRLWIKLQRQPQTDAAFGEFRWRGNLPRSRKGRGVAVKTVKETRATCHRISGGDQ